MGSRGRKAGAVPTLPGPGLDPGAKVDAEPSSGIRMPEVQVVPLSSLRGAAYNPRAISPEALAGLRRSMELYGYADPIIVNRRTGNTVVGGHQRLKVLRSAGIKSAPVVFVDLDAKKERQLNVALNSPAIAGDFTADLEGMIDEFKLELPEADFEALKFDDLLKEIPPEEQQELEEDVAPTPPAKAISRTGDLWEIGGERGHRILCGDSAKAEDVERVMDGEKAGLMNTDPPYGVSFEHSKYIVGRKKKWAGISGDQRRGVELTEWLCGVIRISLGFVLDDAGFYFWTAALREGAAAAAIENAGLFIQGQIIWSKNHFGLGQSDYQWKHENCWYAFKKGAKHRWFGGRAQTTVWDIKRIPSGRYGHPMQKPIELFSIPIQNHLREGEICYEPFSGSGSQLIAAQKLSRRCFAIEICEKYVDVAVLRLMRAAPDLPVKCSRPEAVKAMKERIRGQAEAEA